MSHRPLLAFLVCLFACSSPTPAGEILFIDDLRDLTSAETRESLGEPDGNTASVSLPDGGDIEVRTAIAATPEGGAFILEVTLTVTDAGGWQMSAARSGNPVNRGDGTGNAARMSQNFLITRVKTGLTGTETRQTAIEVGPGGAVSIVP